MNTIEKLGDDETFRQIVERSITSFEDNELTEADALRIAEEWFIEREPTIYVEELEPSSFGSV